MFLIFFNFLYKQNDIFFLSESYQNIYFFMIISAIMSILMLSLPYFFGSRTLKNIEKISEYECGFEPFDSAIRQPFTIHFYIIGILFLIFDVEIALIFPWSIFLMESGWIGFWVIFFF